MTPAERARQIDREEFAAESRAALARALSYAERRRAEERAAFVAVLQREPVKLIPLHLRAFRPKATSKPQVAAPSPAPKLTPLTAPKPIKIKPVVFKQPKPVKIKQPKPVVVKTKKLFTVNGMTLSKVEWAKHLGITYGALMVRMSRLGSLEAAIKLDKKRKAFNVNGKSVTQWAEHFGLPRAVLYRRIKIDGSAERVINELIDCPPVIYRYGTAGAKLARTYTYEGETLSIREWAAITGLNIRTLRSRLATGWTIEHALKTLPNGRPGVSSDFSPSRETGGRGTSQETPNITFSGIDA